MFLPLFLAQTAPDVAPPELSQLERLGPWGVAAGAVLALAIRVLGPAIVAFFMGRTKAEADRTKAEADRETKRDEFLQGLVTGFKTDARERDKEFLAALDRLGERQAEAVRVAASTNAEAMRELAASLSRSAPHAT